MNIRNLLFALLLFPVMIQSCKKDENDPLLLHIVCEDFRPFNYMEDGQLTGITVDLVDSIMFRMGQSLPEIEVSNNWEASLETVKSSSNGMIFTTVMTAERKEEFQWVGPVMIATTGFVGMKNHSVSIETFEAAKQLNAVGVVNGYSTAEILEQAGFDNLIEYETINEAIIALYDGTLPALFDLNHSIRAIATSIGKDAELLCDLYNHSSVQGFLAFSPRVTPSVIDAWQEELDRLKTDGIVQQIYDRYLPGTKAPGLLTIYTEENQPQSFRNSRGEITGSSVEIVQEMMKEMPREEPITITAWSDAYEQILLIPNTMAFSTLRSEQREALFHWIGPVCRKNYCFFVNATTTRIFHDLEEFKSLDKIGVPRGWASEEELIALGFSNLVAGNTPRDVFEMLMTGAVNAAVLNDIAITTLARETGYQAADVRKEYTLSSGDTYLAFNLETKSSYIQEWQQAFEKIRSNGTFATIWKKWYPDLDVPLSEN